MLLQSIDSLELENADLPVTANLDLLLTSSVSRRTIHRKFLGAFNAKNEELGLDYYGFNSSPEAWKRELATMRRAGIDCILPEVYNNHEAFYESRHLPVVGLWLEKLLPLAKEEGLEVHAWVHCMPCNIERIIREHPEWYTVNRNGDSSRDKPAYSNHYKFLCPNRPGAQEFVCTTIKELAQMDGLDGVHLDYIRYPDVILAKALQVKKGHCPRPGIPGIRLLLLRGLSQPISSSDRSRSDRS